MQQAITWTSVDQDLCQMASPGHSESTLVMLDLFLGNKKLYFLPFLNVEMVWVFENLPVVRQGPVYSILQNQYHDCWWPGNPRSGSSAAMVLAQLL